VRALAAAAPGGPGAIAAGLVNGLEPVVRGLWPGLAEIKAALVRAGALGALMSGSGPTVFGVAGSAAAAERIRRALAERPWRCWVTRTVAGPALSMVGGGDPAGRKASTGWGVAKR
ncbi:MAG: hypothetical protein ACREMB_19205, partial [Candidatus Rokuibacteriota bacterium]